MMFLLEILRNIILINIEYTKVLIFIKLNKNNKAIINKYNNVLYNDDLLYIVEKPKAAKYKSPNDHPIDTKGINNPNE